MTVAADFRAIRKTLARGVLDHLSQHCDVGEPVMRRILPLLKTRSTASAVFRAFRESTASPSLGNRLVGHPRPASPAAIGREVEFCVRHFPAVFSENRLRFTVRKVLLSDVLGLVDLGDLRCEFRLAQVPNDGLLVHVEGDKREAGCPHPHVNSAGRVCFGNLAPTFWTALYSSRFYDAAAVLEQLLRSYNYRDCYRSLSHWVKKPCCSCGAQTSSPVMIKCPSCGGWSCLSCANYYCPCGARECAACREQARCPGCLRTACHRCVEKDRCGNCGARLCKR